MRKGITGCKKQTRLTEVEIVIIIKQFDDGWHSKNIKKETSVLSPVLPKREAGLAGIFLYKQRVQLPICCN